MNYILSWYCVESVPRLIDRPWWAFWRHDELRLEFVVVRKNLTLTHLEGRHLQSHWNDKTSIHSVVRKLMGKDVTYVQLEIGNEAAPYIPSAYVSVGHN